MNGDPKRLKTKTRDGEIKELKNKTKNHDYEIFLRTLNIDNHYQKKEWKHFSKKSTLSLPESLLESSSTILSSTISSINPSTPVPIESSSTLMTSLANLIMKGSIRKLKRRYTKLEDWLEKYSLLIEKTSKQSMIFKEK